jgi:hypothetical protein
MHEKDHLDRIVESSLASYGDPGPDSGLAERILARISVEEAPHPSTAIWLRIRPLWAVALPLAACLFIVFFGLRTSTPPSVNPAPRLPQPASTTAESEHAAPPHTISASRRPHSQRSVTATKQASLPKLDVFPMPQPLSPEEQALYAFATQVPEKQRQAILEAQKNDDAPLNVASIRIQPLEIPDTSKN